MFQVKFADIGEGIHEGVVFKIHVDTDGQVKEGESIMAIETDKVTADIPSPVSGKIVKMDWKPGDRIEVGQIIAVVDDGIDEIRSNMEPEEMDMPEKAKSETVTEEGSTSVVGEIEVSSEVIASSSEVHEKASTIDKIKKVLATPVARKMAKDLGIDIKSIDGSGPAGRVLKADIQKAYDALKGMDQNKATAGQTSEKDRAKVQEDKSGGRTYAPSQPMASASTSNNSFDNGLERIPMSMIRKTISSNMTQSKFTIPHTAVMDEVDVTDLVAYRSRTKEMAETNNIKLTYLAFVIKAVTTALKKHTVLNASYDEENQEILIKHFYNIGIAVDAPQGLMVPVIHNADSKGILELAGVLADLSARAKDKQLHPDELGHGTFTITNYGAFGSSYGVPIIRFPEAAVLGIGAIRKKPVVIEDEIVVRSIMPLSMSFDHRIMDGADAGKFIRTLKALLENPDLLVLS